MPISGPRLLHELPHLLLQLYETCSIGEGGPPASRQDEQQQASALLLLVQHSILREMNIQSVAGSVCNGDSVNEPWHRGGLQELGACSSLCNSLEAVELALQCTGQVALLLPPCCWLPLIAVHLGLQKEVHLYIQDKERALAIAVAEKTERQVEMRSEGAAQEEKEFLQMFPGGYKFVVDTLGLNAPKHFQNQHMTALGAAPGKTSSAVKHICSSESRKQALLLLARLLRGLKRYNRNEGQQEVKKQQVHMGVAKETHRGVYSLGREELWLLVRIIEQVQGPECGTDSEDNMPFTAALLLQLLHAAGELCQMETKSLFAAALLQQVDCRSHQEIAREMVGHSR